MNKVMECTYELIDCLENSDIINNITIYKKRIMNNKEIRELIDKGNNSQDEYVIMDIKKKLYQYSDYKSYIDNYNNLMYIVMDINNRMKRLINDKGCYKI